ncbi:MAG: hypothetical protein A2504_05935 [Bdellovibrionales bacterium RIFOXYD12_FULL_39_22]|nr:MAG: hypothetical protein A2385_08255 [Bdellovibrionales bacterium RIFOXYB1_FULL_39_21]OFZ45305.1 MAG: hypothetical protein A2485_06285 [Bdellovibrionales bacterium RIFOXYC12_FULL_39_17]OFZ45506.1 MAG: hypothetical protein A2404_02835 [Bdellovibrionales bacterium RIFOXYC1_FULL_39_130]OFZ73728.1 MAG: hypothetical protein A2451_14825 [Bdellovibrionales bacterium RIFOXYC2_FULL_39_8]OFZ77367.1 MAG: hypothetical protein A2560_08425 [Bdellovibrionales bacterium RIFOXYD1_FULL_39_84]OFZ91496.1 MAG:
MRISEKEKNIILSTLNSFHHKDVPNTKIFLHGSRIDDNLKGGDIDLFWIIDDQYYENTVSKKHYIVSDLSLKLNEQRVDLTIIKMSDKNGHSFFNNSQKLELS